MTPEGDPQVSVIVPARNGAGSVSPLLEALAAQTLAPSQYEVIVVDNASTDATGDIARRRGARVVAEPVANRSRARNRGAEVARAPLFAFTDADCVPRSTWLERLLSCAHRAPLVAGDVRLTASPLPNAIERFEALWRFSQEAWVAEGWAATANLLVQAEAFRAIGGFDTTWAHIGEDVDFCFRACAAGFALAYCGEAVVDHEGERELRPFLRRSFVHGYSVNQAFYRHGAGYRAWRRPAPLLSGRRAMELVGLSRACFSDAEWRAMAALARVSYGARVVGSVWAEVRGAR